MSAVTEDTYRELVELETVLEELVDSYGWQALKEEVGRTLEHDRRRLLGGEVKDHDEYLKISWRIRGSEAVLDAPNDVSNRVKEYRRQLAELETAEV